MKKPKGFILQEGFSPIDGEPFVVVLTLDSTNRKTGNMAQVWILRSDIDPVTAIATGQDLSICGNCRHRKQADGSRTCYVNVGQAPLAVWRTYKKGGYETDLTVSDGERYLSRKKIRWGAYGDPGIIDPVIFHAVNGAAAGHTGYTHQWREPFAQWAKGSLQASCDGLRDYLEASSHGWKTFAVVPKGSNGFSGRQCPATVEASEAQCQTCSLCDGDKADIFVEVHGTGSKHFKPQ